MRGRWWEISLWTVILATKLLAAEADGRTFHVDAQRGNNIFPGTPAEPFNTVSRAAELAEPGDTVLIHEGLYHEQLSKGNSGRPGAPITYAGTDRGKVVMLGSVRVKDWRPQGVAWVKQGLSPITHVNAFVMVDEKSMLTKEDSPANLPRGGFHLSKDGTYTIRLWDDRNPNTECEVDVYELDFGFNSGNRWGGTAKKHIVLRDLTLEKYGVSAVSTDVRNPRDNSHWELDGLIVRHNGAEGVFHCLDGWYVHGCEFIRNRGHGCQIDGAQVRFSGNRCSENMWFGFYPDGGCGLLIGPDASAHSCEVSGNVFERNGGPKGYGCGIYLEGRSHHNLIDSNLIVGGSHAGIGFFGSSYNTVVNNVIVDVAPSNKWTQAAAFVVSHSYEGATTQSLGNLVAHNTIWGCPNPIFADEPSEPVESTKPNRFVNNLFARCRFFSRAPSNRLVVGEGNGCCLCPDGREDRTSLQGLWERALKRFGQAWICRPPFGQELGPDPGFQAAGALDFRLKADSRLIGQGTPCPEVSKDRAGFGRPAGSRPTIGAYEYTNNPH